MAKASLRNGIKRLSVVAPLFLASACASAAALPLPTITPLPSPQPPTSEQFASPALPTLTPTVEPLTSTPILTPTSLPSLTPTATAEPTPASFAEFPGNVADGKEAPDFSARMLGGGRYKLSEQRGKFVLLFPASINCSLCLFSVQQVAEVYPEYRHDHIQVVIVDLYVNYPPEALEIYKRLFDEPDFIWSVAESSQFVMDYAIQELGGILLIDPEGKIVLQTRNPLLAEDYRVLLELMLKGQFFAYE